MMRAASNSMLMPTAAPPGPAYWGLTFVAEEAGSTIAMEKVSNTSTLPPAVSLETSTDGETWTPFIIGTTVITLAEVGDRVFFRAGDGGTGGDGVNIKFATSMSRYNRFVMTGTIAARGDISSILDRSGTVLSFAASESLAVRSSVFTYLFNGCASLTAAPKLPADTLASNCYNGMFYGCVALATAPELPATVLTSQCYRHMFNGCVSLVSAPTLPAVKVASNCYRNMFTGCTRLCSVDICVMQLSSSGVVNQIDWLSGVAQTGTIRILDVYGDNLTVDRGPSAVPEGWTVEIKHCPYFTVAGGKVPAYTSTAGWQYSTDFGSTWTDWDGTELSAESYSLYMFATKEPRQVAPSNFIGRASGSFTRVGGNPGSLLSKENPRAPLVEGNGRPFCALLQNNTNIISAKLDLHWQTLTTRCYMSMFAGCSSLRSGPDLPATTLAPECYYWMFGSCASLISAPVLPATTLAARCYEDMFGSCTSLTVAPALPATTLADGCYHMMFYHCTALTAAPALPATTLATSCYYEMFNGCTSLTAAPALPATTLAANCYNGMFYGCVALATAPELPATTLANSCYYRMFQECTALSWIEVHFAVWAAAGSSSSVTYLWVSNVAASGTFHCPAALGTDETIERGTNRCPNGWTVINI